VFEKSLKTLQLALGVGAVALGTATAASFASSAGRVVETEPDASTVTRPSVDASFARYGVIADRDVFRSRLRPAPSAPVLEESALDVQLLGTLVAEKRIEPRKRHKLRKARRSRRNPLEPPVSHAILRDIDGEVHTLRIGETFAKQSAKLVEIDRRRIVIERAGKLEAVTLHDESTGATMAGVQKSEGIALAMLEKLVPGGSVDFVGDDEVEAYRVSGAATTDEFQEDDRIRAINGVSLLDPDLDVRIKAALREGSELRLTVEDASGRLRAVPVPARRIEQVH
jgi:hypothetical protein